MHNADDLRPKIAKILLRIAIQNLVANLVNPLLQASLQVSGPTYCMWVSS